MATDTSGRFDERDGSGLRVGLDLDDPKRLLRGVAGIVGFLGLWYLVSLTQPAYVLPSPAAVGTRFLEELGSGTMTAALASSVRHWLPGTVVGTGLGVGAGVAFSWSGFLDDLTAPLVRTLRPVPPLALIGFAIAWFGINDAGAAFIIAVGAFWINFYAAYGAVEGVSEDLLDVGWTLGVSGDLDMVRSVVLPAALPGITTGIRTGLGRCWMLVVAAEIFGVPGVGREILRASNNLLVDKVIAYILVLSLMYLLVDVAFRAVQRRVLIWQA
ncbi:NitT/TauT family transport system permease protein [Halorubrum aquaticum]|uniref:NitT/TauT family transport system permease protein n=1 Tax=Halorubrum aquaticum TaxID=387340 RepID=A0A1I3AEZ5_9EURY|nr:ABC transporter permease [Halorubrum aquaticum]SFH48426.1 NitT/TauT family transport system permease protein [Halorubrum aquaticum]